MIMAIGWFGLVRNSVALPGCILILALCSRVDAGAWTQEQGLNNTTVYKLADDFKR